MREVQPGRVHLITGGYPPGALAQHDMDYARIRLLELLEERGVQATVGNDFTDIEKWLPGTSLMLTYTAGPFLSGDQNKLVRRWMEDGGRWFGLHGTSGGRAKRVEGERRRMMVKSEHHDTLGELLHQPSADQEVQGGRVGGGESAYQGLAVFVHDHRRAVHDRDPAPERNGRGTVGGAGARSLGVRVHLRMRTLRLQADGKTRVLGYTHGMWGRAGWLT